MTGCFIEDMYNEYGGKSTYTCKCMDCKHFTIEDERLYDGSDDMFMGWCKKKEKKTVSCHWSSVCDEFEMIDELYSAMCKNMLKNMKV